MPAIGFFLKFAWTLNLQGHENWAWRRVWMFGFFFPETSPRGFNALLSLHTLGTIWGVTPLLLFRWVTLASLSFWSMCNWEQPPSWSQCPHYFHSEEVFQGCSAILHIILRRADANSLNTEDNPSPISLLTLLLWVCPFRTSDSSPIIILGIFHSL